MCVCVCVCVCIYIYIYIYTTFNCIIPRILSMLLSRHILLLPTLAIIKILCWCKKEIDKNHKIKKKGKSLMLGLSSPLLSTEFMIQVPKCQWREISQKGCLHYQMYLAHLTEGQGGAESPCCWCWHFPSCVFRGLVYKTAESLASLWSILSQYNLKPRFHQVAPLSFRALPAPSPSRCNGRTLHCGVLPVGPPPTLVASLLALRLCSGNTTQGSLQTKCVLVLKYLPKAACDTEGKT